jgi:hypothetical protein
MSTEGCGGHAPDVYELSDEQLRAAIVGLEGRRHALEAECQVVRRRLALLRAERLARVRDGHFDAARVAEALLRRLPELSALLAQRAPAEE